MASCSSPPVLSVQGRQNSPTGADHKRNQTQYQCQTHCPGGERSFSDFCGAHQTYSVATQTLLTSFPPPPSVPRNNSTAGSPTLTDCSSGSPSVDIQPEPESISVKENMEPVMSAGQGADQIREVGDEVTNILQRTEVKVQWGSGSYVLLGLVTFVTSFAVMYLYQHRHLTPASTDMKSNKPFS
ncbi:unnamed protein product [Arctogadus glacialis]